MSYTIANIIADKNNLPLFRIIVNKKKIYFTDDSYNKINKIHKNIQITKVDFIIAIKQHIFKTGIAIKNIFELKCSSTKIGLRSYILNSIAINSHKNEISDIINIILVKNDVTLIHSEHNKNNKMYYLFGYVFLYEKR